MDTDGSMWAQWLAERMTEQNLLPADLAARSADGLTAEMIESWLDDGPPPDYWDALKTGIALGVDGAEAAGAAGHLRLAHASTMALAGVPNDDVILLRMTNNELHAIQNAGEAGIDLFGEWLDAKKALLDAGMPTYEDDGSGCGAKILIVRSELTNQ